MTIFTADVSSHDGPVDWTQATRAGITAAFVKATEGGGGKYRYTNPLFVEQHDGAVDVGLAVVGAYHCLSGDEVDQQISYFTQALQRGKTATTTIPGVMLDVEPFDELRRSGALPDFGHVETFCDRWARTGEPLALYLPRWVWEDFGRPSLTGLAGQVRLISSNYPTNTPRQPTSMYAFAGADGGPGWAPYGGMTPELWQFGSNCMIPGIRGGVGGADVNAFRGTAEQLAELFAPAHTTTAQPHGGDPMLTHWSTVKRGSTGPAVKVAEALLIAHGLPVGCDPNHLDGAFGPACEFSTRALQARFSLQIDGEFGPHTLSVALYGRNLA